MRWIRTIFSCRLASHEPDVAQAPPYTSLVARRHESGVLTPTGRNRGLVSPPAGTLVLWMTSVVRI